MLKITSFNNEHRRDHRSMRDREKNLTVSNFSNRAVRLVASVSFTSVQKWLTWQQLHQRRPLCMSWNEKSKKFEKTPPNNYWKGFAPCIKRNITGKLDKIQKYCIGIALKKSKKYKDTTEISNKYIALLRKMVWSYRKVNEPNWACEYKTRNNCLHGLEDQQK